MNTFFKSIKTLEELKKEYRRLAMINHPDLGGDIDTMKALNAEYDHMVRSGIFAEEMTKTKTNEDESIMFKDLIGSLIVLQGLIIEVCGSWLWVSGETKENKEDLKVLGLKFAPKKQMWFWRPEEDKSKNRKPMDIDEIRARHGSTFIANKFCLTGS